MLKWSGTTRVPGARSNKESTFETALANASTFLNSSAPPSSSASSRTNSDTRSASATTPTLGPLCSQRTRAGTSFPRKPISLRSRQSAGLNEHSKNDSVIVLPVRLMVGQRPLKPLIGVRIPDRQHFFTFAKTEGSSVPSAKKCEEVPEESSTRG